MSLSHSAGQACGGAYAGLGGMREGAEGAAPGAANLLELILKDVARLHEMIRDRARQVDLLPRLLAISLVSFVLYGIAMSVVLQSAGVWPQLTPIAGWLDGDSRTSLLTFAEAGERWGWLHGSVVLTASYVLGLIAATGVCLPSLYFYGLLAGVRMSMLDVTIHALKAKATAAVALVGILPIYAATALGAVIFNAPPLVLHAALWLGLILPFLAGLAGTRSLYVGFTTLCDTLPEERRGRRACFLRRLVLSWSGVYTAVTPVMIYTLWAWLAV